MQTARKFELRAVGVKATRQIMLVGCWQTVPADALSDPSENCARLNENISGSRHFCHHQKQTQNPRNVHKSFI